MPGPVTNPNQILDTPLQDVVARFADPVIGINPQLAATIASQARYRANASFLTNSPLVFPVNYTGMSPNVILAPVSIDDWFKTSPIAWPLLLQIYVVSGNNTMRNKGAVYDGPVIIGVDIHISWLNSPAIFDFDAAVSAVENSVYAIFNTHGAPYQVKADGSDPWSQGSNWTGRLSVPTRSGMVTSGLNWRQMTAMTMQWDLIKY